MGEDAPPRARGNVRRNRSWTWKPAFLFLGLGLGTSVPPLIGQPTDQVWGQLTEQSAAAQNNGYKRLNYMIGYLDNGKEPLDNWPVHLAAGSSYLIVGVCDNDCTDVDLSLEAADRSVVASDLLEDDLPMIQFTPNTGATYWLRPTMAVCNVNPCGYGIVVLVR